MGKKLSTEEFGIIRVNTEKKNYTAGDQVNGLINLSLKKRFPSNLLMLIITGKEEVKLTTSTMSGSGEDTTSDVIVHRDENEFYGHRFVIYEGPEKEFIEGNYSFPFSFKLVDNLPGSFYFEFNENGEKCFAKTEYRIWAGLKNEKNNNVLFDSFDFFVDQKFDFNTGPTTRVFESNLKGYCCSNLGRLNLTCTYSADSFMVGDPAHITIGINAKDLHSDIKKIKISLIQIITMKAKNETQVKRFEVTNLTIQGLKKGEQKILENSIPVSLPIQTRSTKEASSNGVLVQNDFKLEIKPELDSCLCCSEDPVNQIPIKIFNKKFKLSQQPFFFENNIQPQQMNPYICSITNDYRMTTDMRNFIYIDENVDYPENVN